MDADVVQPPIQLANMTPLSEATAATAGTTQMAARPDHVHPRLTSASTGLLNASGEATVTFTRTFSSKPSVCLLYAEAADGQPVVFKVKSWLGAGGAAWTSGDYTGCVIKGYRAQTIPTNLVSLLLGGVFNLFAASASGVEYSIIVLQAS
jgi:hypothetical protein